MRKNFNRHEQYQCIDYPLHFPAVSRLFTPVEPYSTLPDDIIFMSLPSAT